MSLSLRKSFVSGTHVTGVSMSPWLTFDSRALADQQFRAPCLIFHRKCTFNRARLRIAKPPSSERRFSSQNNVTSRQENAEFSQILHSTNNEQKTRHSSTNSS